MDDFDLHSDVLTDLASLPVEDSPTGQAHDLSTVADLLWEGVDLPSSSNTSVLRLVCSLLTR